jgi:hypothetical protein
MEYSASKRGYVVRNREDQMVFISDRKLRDTPTLLALKYIQQEFDGHNESIRKVKEAMQKYSLYDRTISGYSGQTGTSSSLNDWVSDAEMGLFQQQAYKAMQGSINLDLGPTREEEEERMQEERMQVKLTLREAQYLEEITAREPMLKEILAKIEEGADFQIVVSFRDKDED